MIETCRNRLRVFHAEYVEEVEGSFFIEERDEGGAGKAMFASEAPCIILRTNDTKPMLLALKNRKCADGAFISYEDDGFHLHIVELKSKLTLSKWAHVLKQFEGMYLTALATCRLLDIQQLQSVTCYIAYSDDKMDPAQSASPILLKTFVGKPNPMSGQSEWEGSKVDLPFNATAGLVKRRREPATGDADFGNL